MDKFVFAPGCALFLYKPHLVDLLFAEATVPGTTHPEAWHAELDEFMASHQGGK
jgi:hypothetical protein